MRSILSANVAVATLMTALAATATEPVGWRLDGTGQYPKATPPTKWSAEENVVWKTAMPGPSYASPIVVGDRIFVTSQPAALLCVRASDGDVLWQRPHTYVEIFGAEAAKKIGDDRAKATKISRQIAALLQKYKELQKNDPPPKGKLQRISQQVAKLRATVRELTRYPRIPKYDSGRNAGNAAATPVSDGTTVYAAFATGIVSAHTLDGNRRWMKFVEAPRTSFGHASSPVLASGKVIIHFANLIALDAETGKEVWRVKLKATHSTPVATRVAGVDVLLTASGAIVRATDGKVLAASLYRLSHSSPVVHDGVVYVHQNGMTKALRLPQTAGDTLEVEPLWEGDATRSGYQCPSPVFHDGLLYGVSLSGILEVTDAKSGKFVYRQRLPIGRVYPSPTLAGDLLFIGGNGGKMVVVQPGRQYKELALNDLERFTSCPVFAGQRMYVRAEKHLYCIGQ